MSAAVRHTALDLRLLRAADDEGNSCCLLVHGVTDQVALLPGDAWALRATDGGWMYAHMAGYDSVWVVAKLTRHVCMASDGRRFISEKGAAPVWIDELGLSGPPRYAPLLLGDVAPPPRVKIYKFMVPDFGQILYFQLRDFQEPS